MSTPFVLIAGGLYHNLKNYLLIRPPLRGYDAAAFVNSLNSDMENGKLKGDAPPAQLYNLDTDPNQTLNVWHQNPDMVARMDARLMELRDKLARK